VSIRVEGITKRFGSQVVLDGVSLEIASGELFVLLGASGSGKSTLLRIIAGLSAPDRGRVWLGGRDVTRVRPQQRGTGFVFQNYSVFRHMTVGQNIEFGLRLRGVARAERARRRDALLELVGLPGFASREAQQLSGGQQQRVAIARALAYQPDVLLLDEPFGALDVKIRTQLRRSLREIQARLRITTVLVTHDQDEAFELSDRVGLMDRGRLIEVGSAEDLYARPRTLFGATFLGSGTVLSGRVIEGRARFRGLGFSVAPRTPHRDGSSAHLLVRPEDVHVASNVLPRHMPELGLGQVVEESFAGSLRRVWVRFEHRTDVHPASAPATDGGFTVEAVLPAHERLEGREVRVGLRRWHFLDPPAPSVLVADDGRGTRRALELARTLAETLEAQVSVLGVAREARDAGALGARIERRVRRARLAAFELRLRYGATASQILAEQAELLSRVVVVAVRPKPWLALRQMVGRGRRRNASGPTLVALFESTHVPVVVAAGDAPALAHGLVVATPAARGTDFLTECARSLAELRAAASFVDLTARPTDGEGGEARPLGATRLEEAGIEVRARASARARNVEGQATAALQMPVDFIMLPLVRSDPRQPNEMEPLIEELLSRTDRPLWLVPVDREDGAARWVEAPDAAAREGDEAARP
jgi:ABC-type Fe3+/spermidine/putrescine transport system ATPase subunit